MLRLDLDTYTQQFPAIINHSLCTKIPENLIEEAQNWGFLNLSPDRVHVNQYREWAQTKHPWVKHIVLAGIGGSALGGRVLYDVFTSQNPNQPTLTILDTLDVTTIESEFRKIDLASTVFLIISKSGKTPETLAQYSYIINRLTTYDLDVSNHLTLISTTNQGFLWSESVKRGLTFFSIPEDIGGRFSVLTAAGLVLAELLSINSAELLNGAQSIFSLINKENFHQTSVYQSSVFQYIEHSINKKNIHVFMPYIDRLTSFSYWWSQLLAESLGKRTPVSTVGLTPLAALGVRDQHSLLQLFADGPDDKMYSFIKPLTDSPESLNTDSKMLIDLMTAEYQGTVMSLSQIKRPIFEFSMDYLDEYHLGCLFAFIELQVAITGFLLGVNPFDQPGVERSKLLSQAFLNAKKTGR